MGSALLGTLLGFVAKLILGYLNDQRAAASEREAGAAELDAKINKESADAERRAGEVVETKPSDLDARLDSGMFGR